MHYTAVVGQKIKLKLYNAVDGVKEFTGTLLSADGDIVLDVDGEKMQFALKDISKANVAYFE